MDDEYEYDEQPSGCVGKCWNACCPCIARVMSLPKCLSLIPLWPMIGLGGVTVSGGVFLTGIQKFYQSIGIEVNDMTITFTIIGYCIILFLDFLFVYSVCSNKMRIHKVHCMAEGCRGYRIKDSLTCGSCFLRTCCKMYNGVLVTLNWFAFLIATIVAAVMSFASCVALSIVSLCVISESVVQQLVNILFDLQGQIDASPVAGWIMVSNTTNSTLICDQQTELTWSAFFMVVGGVCMLVCQVILLVSYLVVAEVSWRTMKDTHREGERTEMIGKSQRAKVLPGDYNNSSSNGNSGDAEQAYAAEGGYGAQQGYEAEAPPKRVGLPSFSGSQPPQDYHNQFTHQTSFGHSNAQTSQNI